MVLVFFFFPVKNIVMNKLFLILFLGIINVNIYTFDYTETNATKQISEYFEETDFSILLATKDVGVSIDISENEKCKYNNQYLNYGNDVYPKVSDSRRVDAIVKLITKIINCEKLPFKEDGQTFYNREGKLPQMPKGYYQEYTLLLPKDAAKEFYVGDMHFTAYPSYGSRGPERIVIGGGKIIYYTPTHYNNFVEIKIINSKDYQK